MMKKYSELNGVYKLYQGNMLEMLDVIAPNSIDSIITDPPYELNFMGKGWDNSGIAFQKETWEKCYQVLKSGGYLLAFGGSRTFHRIACAIEDAGFEIRDTIMWLYGSGFPKSMNIGLAIDKKNGVDSEIVGYTNLSMPDFKDAGAKNVANGGMNKVGYNVGESADRMEQPIYKAQNEWAGWGTALKPAYEPIIIARKPCENSCVDNVLKYGTGGINIDECRIPTTDTWHRKEQETNTAIGYQRKNKSMYAQKSEGEMNENGRFPSNVILTYDDSDYEEVCGEMPNTNCERFGKSNAPDNYGDEGSASRYFYCAKASKKDRDEGLDAFQKVQRTDGSIRSNAETGRIFGGNSSLSRNIHPTVKPTSLMQYLVRLVSPKNATILDCFNGSGSTGKAVMWENKERDSRYKYIGIEMTAEYLPIADARIRYVMDADMIPDDITEEIAPSGQMSIFDLMGD